MMVSATLQNIIYGSKVDKYLGLHKLDIACEAQGFNLTQLLQSANNDAKMLFERIVNRR